MANMSSTDINKSQTSKTNKTKAKGNSSSSKSYKVRTFKEYSEGATEASKSIENKSYEFPGIDKVNGLVVVFDVWDMAATGEGLLNDISAGTAKMVADLNQNLNTMVKSVQNLGGDSVSSISGIENTVMDIGGVFKSAFGVEAGKFKDSGAVISGYTAAFEKLKDINSSSNGAGDLIVPKPTELSFKFPVMTKLGDDSN